MKQKKVDLFSFGEIYLGDYHKPVMIYEKNMETGKYDKFVCQKYDEYWCKNKESLMTRIIYFISDKPDEMTIFLREEGF